MPATTPLDRLGAELRAAAERQMAPSPTSPGRRRVRRSTLAFAVALLAACAVAAAWAATTLLSTGNPVSFARGAPIAGRALGAPVPGTVRLLTTSVADPDGGVPWGLRFWETDRKYACVQVGRVYRGKLGQISAGNVFHELPLGRALGALGGCYALDGGGHAFVAIHTDAEQGGQLPACEPGFAAGTRLRGPDGRVDRCDRPDRTVDFGLLGPNATSFSYRAGGDEHTTAPLGGVGAYLVVQRRIKPVIRVFGFHHRDPRLDLRGPAEPYIAVTPGSQVIRRIEYRAGECTAHVTSDLYGSCYRLAGFVPIPQPRIGDVRAPIHVFPAPHHRGIRVRFRAPRSVVDGRSVYDIEVRPVHGRAFATQPYAHNIAKGGMVRTTVDLYNRERGPYRIVVRYRTIKARPGPLGDLPYSRHLVGQAHVNVP